MFIQKFLYDFGVSQDDPQSELKALQPLPGDRILCIASAGEVPLELLVQTHKSIKIDAVDIAQTQLFLSNLKLQAAIHLDPEQASRFLGYFPTNKKEREKAFNRIKSSLPTDEINFWVQNKTIFQKGPIHLGRYETYIARFAPLGRWLLGGRQRLSGLFETSGIKEQKDYFDTKLRITLLKNLFWLMFHPWLYKKRGVSEQGLIHVGPSNIGLKFYAQFRDFCTGTPVRKNWILQFVLFNKVIYQEALPFYLTAKGRQQLRNEKHRLQFINASYSKILKQNDQGKYNKFALSNVSDWLSTKNFMDLMNLISRKAGNDSRGLIRYIHSSGIDPSRLGKNVKLDENRGKYLLKKDRFPFYNLIPFTVTKYGKYQTSKSEN